MPRRLDVGAHGVVILDPRLGLEPRAGVDRPGPDAPDRLADIVRRELAREHDAALRRGARAPSGRDPRRPTGVRARVRPARRHAAGRRRGRGRRRSPVRAPGRGRRRRRPPRRPRRRRPASSPAPGGRLGGARTLAGEHEAGQVGAGLGGDVDILLSRQSADLDERRARAARAAWRPGRARASASSRRGSRPRRRARPRRPARGCAIAALGDDDAVARRACDELELRRGGRSRTSRGRVR